MRLFAYVTARACMEEERSGQPSDAAAIADSRAVRPMITICHGEVRCLLPPPSLSRLALAVA